MGGERKYLEELQVPGGLREGWRVWGILEEGAVLGGGAVRRSAGLQCTGDMSQASSMGREGPYGEEAQKPLEDLQGRVWVPGLPLPQSASADTPPHLYLLTKMEPGQL